MIKPVTEEKWDWKIQTNTHYWGWDVRELWSYRHLLLSLVRRDFLLNYQQTVLGPLWVLFQPLLTLATFILVFDKLVGISTGAVPAPLFYFSGIVLWNFFSESFGGTSFTFKENAPIFSKVYFPRIIVPFSVITTHFIRFIIQFVFLLLFIAYYWLALDFTPAFSFVGILAVPVVLIFTGIVALSLGLFFSVITAKYRDMGNLVNLGLRLFMFVTPVIYPLGSVPEHLRWIVQLNPLTPLFELFRFGLLGEGSFEITSLLYSTLFTLFIFFAALMLFNKQGDKLIDVV